MLRTPNLPGKTVGDRKVIEIGDIVEELAVISQSSETEGREVSESMKAIMGMMDMFVRKIENMTGLEMIAARKDADIFKNLLMENIEDGEDREKLLKLIEKISQKLDKNHNKYIELTKFVGGIAKDKVKEKMKGLSDQFIGGLHPMLQGIYNAGKGGIGLYQQFKESEKQREEAIRSEFASRVESPETIDKSQDIETTARDITDIQRLPDKTSSSEIQRQPYIEPLYSENPEKRAEFSEGFQSAMDEELEHILSNTDKLPEILAFLQNKEAFEAALANEVQRVASDSGRMSEIVSNVLAEHGIDSSEVASEISNEVNSAVRTMAAESKAYSTENVARITEAVDRSGIISRETAERIEKSMETSSRSSFADKEKEEVYRRESLEATQNLAKSIEVLGRGNGKPGSGNTGGTSGGGGIISSALNAIGDQISQRFFDKGLGKIFQKTGLNKVFEKFGLNKIFSLGKDGAEKVAEKSVERLGGQAIKKGAAEVAPKSFAQATKDVVKETVQKNVDKAKEVGKTALQKGKDKAVEVATKVGDKVKDVASPVVDKAKNAVIKAGTPYIEATKQVFAKGGTHAAKTLATNGLKLGMKALPGVGTAMTVYEIVDMAHEYNKENIKAYTDLNEFDSNVSTAQNTENSMGYDLTSAFDDPDAMEGIENIRTGVEERHNERVAKEEAERIERERIERYKAAEDEYRNAVKSLSYEDETDRHNHGEIKRLRNAWKKLDDEQKQMFINEGIGRDEAIGKYGGHDPLAAISRVAYNEKKIYGAEGNTAAELITPEAVERAKKDGVIAQDISYKKEFGNIVLEEAKRVYNPVPGVVYSEQDSSAAHPESPFIYQPINNTYVTNTSGDGGNKMAPIMRNPMPSNVANGEGVTTISVR